MRLFDSIFDLRQSAQSAAAALPALMMQAERIAANIMHGAHGQRKSGTGEKFWQFREYEQSDRPQDIDWRQSAKTDDVYIKQREWQATQKTFLWCAGGKSMDYTSNQAQPTKLETAQIMTLALALLLRAGEEHIGVFGNNKTGRGEHRFNVLGEYLMERKKDGEDLPPQDHFPFPRHAGLIAIGDFLTPTNDIERAFSPLATRTKSGIIIQILDPCELDLTYQGRVRFEGVTARDETLINNVTSIRDKYSTLINDHIKAVEDITHHYGWIYALHRTDQDISETLRHIFQEISMKQAGGHA